MVGTGESPRRADFAIDDFDARVFGLLLVNDWSARDIQAFEYQPLGPPWEVVHDIGVAVARSA